MKKKVNIYTNGKIITSLSIPIRSDIMGVDIEVDDIRKLLINGAIVKEIMPDGSLISLTMDNYSDLNLFETHKAEVAAKQAALNQKRIEEEKLQRNIQEKKASRVEAIKAINSGRFGGAIKHIQPVEDTYNEQSAVDAARAKIEANKNR